MQGGNGESGQVLRTTSVLGAFGGVLERDAAVQAAGVAYLVVAALSLLFVHGEAAAVLRPFAEIAFLLPATVAVGRSGGQWLLDRERGFWLDLRLGLLLLLAATGVDVAFAGKPGVPAVGAPAYVAAILHAVALTLLILGLMRQPELRHRWRSDVLERRLNLPQVAAFASGVYLSFVLLPMVSEPGDLLVLRHRMDAVLALYLLWRSTSLALTVNDPRWRPLYAGFSLAIGSFALTALLGLLPDLTSAEGHGLRTALSPLPWLCFFLLGRLRRSLAPPESTSLREKVLSAESSPEPAEQTLYAAMAFALAHLAFRNLGAAAGKAGAVVETFVFVWLVALALLAVAQHFLWRRGTVKNRHQLRTTQKSLQRLEQKLTMRLAEEKKDIGKLSEDAFATVFRATAEAILVTRMSDARILAVNPACREALGYEEAEMLGRTPRELGLWPDRRERLEMLRLLSEMGEMQDLKIVLRAKSGADIEARVSAKVVELKGEACLVSVVRTGRRSDGSLRALDSLLDGARRAVSLLDPEGRFVYLNRRAEELFGRPAAALVGRRPKDLFATAASAAWNEGRHRLSLRRRDLWVESRSTAVQGLGGWQDSRLVFTETVDGEGTGEGS